MNLDPTFWNVRTQLLLGEEKLEILSKAHVLVVGLGGVGAAAAEMLGRVGIGKLTLVDTDVVEASNRNRQLGALVSTDGMPKVQVWEQRIRDINPDVDVLAKQIYLTGEGIDDLLNEGPYDYVMDCIDTLAPKVYLIQKTVSRGFRIVSSMGAGGKMDPMQVHIADISVSYNCKLARYVRKRLRRLGIAYGVPVVFSPEEIDIDRVKVVEGARNKKSVIGTISYLPPIFGSFCASIVIRDLLGIFEYPKPIKEPRKSGGVGVRPKK